MTQSLWREKPWELMRDLHRLVAERAPAEIEILSAEAAEKKQIERGYRNACRKETARYEQEKAAGQQAAADAEAATLQQYQSDIAAARREYETVRQEAIERFEAAEDSARQNQEEGRWEATAMFEGGRGGLQGQLGKVQTDFDAQWQQFEAIQQEAVKLLRGRWQWRQYPEANAAPVMGVDPARAFSDLLAVARQRLDDMAAQAIPRLFQGIRLLPLYVVLWVACVVPSGRTLGWANYGWWIGLSALAAAVLFAITASILYQIARSQTAQAYRQFREVLASADLARRAALVVAKAENERQVATLAQRRNLETKKAEDACAAELARVRQEKEKGLQAIDEKYTAIFVEMAARRDRQLDDSRREAALRSQQLEQSHREAMERFQRKRDRRIARSEERSRDQWERMTDRWHGGLTRFQLGVDELTLACNQAFPDWNATLSKHWRPASELPSAVPFGRFEVSLGRINGGMPRDARLRPAQTDFALPAMFPFGDVSLLLLKAEAEGRTQAVENLQSVMLRMLTACPPGKVRFTIIDPVGLGENFSAFMHLADYNEQIVSSRIWTDPVHIEQRLAELTAHMEDVIQVYLRNEFQTIEEYNAFAGDLAEPYRVLVVANFPAAFSENAAARLLSIVASGARCGVYTLLSVDTRLRLPREFHLADLERHALRLAWKEGRFHWEQPEFGQLPLVLVQPPPPEPFTDIVKAVGEHVRDAGRVEVPFRCVLPEDDQWWTTDSRAGIDVPLGRAGAMKFQSLRLGRGTSQHVLIAGKTGAGKSTLLHALITNAAVRYSPDELDLYLIDFKKGVEFKAYAQAQLPHARVVAIESEREFGLSVLERLDVELKERGDAFRKLGVQDLPGFRSARPEVRLPRVLLIIDEFQELFVEDDRIAQNASLLLDRLVRQGRAFGIHVILGSQTLAGAYSLPRSTIGQMAVRIALQCSESDAHLILSEDNTAARLLKRPGEAIYNDANGLFEGNHPFQVVWLSDEERDQYLDRVSEMARQRGLVIAPPVVFEGNVPSDLRQNEALQKLWSAPAWPSASGVVNPQAWLGSAVAIKEPTSVFFSRQSGKNLLLVGHQEESALGVLAACYLSLAVQCPPTPPADGQLPMFCVLDGTRPESPGAGFWKRLVGAMPQAAQVAGPRQAGEMIGRVAEELARREEAGADDGSPIYLFVYDLSRFRELRKAEDDFSFARGLDDKPATPAAQFGKILREGPALGIHVLAWCDTYTNTTRMLDRQMLRDVEMRVVFQMNAGDSSNLIDSPAASLLGVHRALFYDEGQGRLEKFRPYGAPPADWLDKLRAELAARQQATPVK